MSAVGICACPAARLSRCGLGLAAARPALTGKLPERVGAAVMVEVSHHGADQRAVLGRQAAA
jgi:hypothetical protein